MNPVGGANGDAGRTTVNKAYAADANDEGKKKSKRNVVNWRCCCFDLR